MFGFDFEVYNQNMSTGNYEIREMTRKELDLAVEWARLEGWNPGLYDADCFYSQDPKGFFVGLLNGEPVASISGVKYEKDYGFAGFYIVKPEFRGRGYGMTLFQKMMNYLKDRNVGGDGVIENLEMYKKVGLHLAHYNARYQGYGTGDKYIGKNIVKLSQVPFEKITDYDDTVFGFKRHKFLKCWINQPESRSFAFVENNELKGYGVIRKCFTGYKIGPLFADNKIVAGELFKSLVGQVEKSVEVFFDIPEINEGSVEITKRYNMKKVFATGRIYTKGQPKFPLEKWFGITTFELG